MFYEDPGIVGERWGWRTCLLVLPRIIRNFIIPVYEQMKAEHKVECFQLLYEVESAFSGMSPDSICNYCVGIYEDVFVIFPYDPEKFDKEGFIKMGMETCTDIFIKKGALENYIIEILFSGYDEEGNSKTADYFIQTLPRLNNKLEKKFGKELGTPHQLISYLKSHPAYKSSL